MLDTKLFDKKIDKIVNLNPLTLDITPTQEVRCFGRLWRAGKSSFKDYVMINVADRIESLIQAHERDFQIVPLAKKNVIYRKLSQMLDIIFNKMDENQYSKLERVICEIDKLFKQPTGCFSSLNNCECAINDIEKFLLSDPEILAHNMHRVDLSEYPLLLMMTLGIAASNKAVAKILIRNLPLYETGKGYEPLIIGLAQQVIPKFFSLSLDFLKYACLYGLSQEQKEVVLHSLYPLIENHCSINTKHQILLEHSVALGNISMVEFLRQYTPIHPALMRLAVKAGNNEMIDYLTHNGANAV